jgi:hypothetical protein
VNQQDVRERAALVAAYRQGLGLAAIAVICGPDGVRLSLAPCDGEIAVAAAETVQERWWCRNAVEAERVVAAATARLRHGNAHAGELSAFACESITRAAKRLNIALQSDQQIYDEAIVAIERINCEIEKLRHAGGLRPVNKSYQAYRNEAASRGERVVPYARWMLTYKESLVRKAAATLRYL